MQAALDAMLAIGTKPIEQPTPLKARLKAAAKSNVTAPPPSLAPVQTELVTELRVEQGPARDAAEIGQQKEAHQQTLAVQKTYAMEGTAPALKSAASKIVPVVQTHIKMRTTA